MARNYLSYLLACGVVKESLRGAGNRVSKCKNIPPSYSPSIRIRDLWGEGQAWACVTVSFFSGTGFFCALMSFNLLGDALRDALDPRLSETR